MVERMALRYLGPTRPLMLMPSSPAQLDREGMASPTPVRGRHVSKGHLRRKRRRVRIRSRFNTCILVDVPGVRFALDFGASSLIALKALGIDHNTIDAIVCTHIHGDHCGGIPFLMLDAMLGAKRQRPLVVGGPIGIQQGVLKMQHALFPGMERMTPRFKTDFVELETEREHEVGPLKIVTYPAVHTPETKPTSIR